MQRTVETLTLDTEKGLVADVQQMKRYVGQLRKKANAASSTRAPEDSRALSSFSLVELQEQRQVVQEQLTALGRTRLEDLDLHSVRSVERNKTNITFSF